MSASISAVAAPTAAPTATERMRPSRSSRTSAAEPWNRRAEERVRRRRRPLRRTGPARQPARPRPRLQSGDAPRRARLPRCKTARERVPFQTPVACHGRRRSHRASTLYSARDDRGGGCGAQLSLLRDAGEPCRGGRGGNQLRAARPVRQRSTSMRSRTGECTGTCAPRRQEILRTVKVSRDATALARDDEAVEDLDALFLAFLDLDGTLTVSPGRRGNIDPSPAFSAIRSLSDISEPPNTSTDRESGRDTHIAPQNVHP